LVNGQIIADTTASKGGSAELYDEKGNLIERIEMGPQGNILRHEKRNYSGNRWIETIFYESDGSINNRIVNTYNEKGQVACDSSYNYRGKFTGRTVFKYDSLGYEIENTRYTEDSPGIYKEVKVYDEQGRITTTSEFLDDKLTDTYISTYDEKGRNTRSRVENPDCWTEDVYTYNDSDRLVEDLVANSFSAADSKHDFKYSYLADDKMGNYIKCINNDGEKPYSVVTRVITYY
jgi:hypothetical protein